MYKYFLQQMIFFCHLTIHRAFLRTEYTDLRDNRAKNVRRGSVCAMVFR